MLVSRVDKDIYHTEQHELILKTMARYCCRITGAAEINKLLHPPLDKLERDRVREIKKWLDFSTYRNNLYKSVWYLAQNSLWSPSLNHLSAYYGIKEDELGTLFSLLSDADRAVIKTRQQPHHFDDEAILEILHSLKNHIKAHVHRKLRFLFTNDPGYSYEDFVGELQCQAIRVIRHYEIEVTDIEAMKALVNQGINNHAKNIAEHKGHPRRSPLLQLTKKKDYKMAWYCNINEDRVDYVRVAVPRRYRKGDYYLAQLPGADERYIHVAWLFPTKEEATQSLEQYRKGEKAHRNVYLDLSNDLQNDWQPVCISVDKTLYNDCTLSTFLSAPDHNITELNLADHNPRMQKFIHICLGYPDPGFDRFCAASGKDSAQLKGMTLGSMARRYLQLNRAEIISALTNKRG